MISEELLSEVLNLKNVVNIWVEEGNTLFYECINPRVSGEINIYELAYKCNEWALSKGISLRLTSRGDVYYALHNETFPLKQDIRLVSMKPDEMFDACQRLLKNKDI